MNTSEFLYSKTFKILLITGVWLILPFLTGSVTYLSSVLRDEPASWGRIVCVDAHLWYIWMLLTPLVLKIARHFPLDNRYWFKNVLILIPTGIAISVLHTFIFLFLRYIFGAFSETGLPSFSFVYMMISRMFVTNILVFWGIIGVKHAIDYYRKYKEKEIRSAQLETELMKAHLQVLKMQIRPHFLFNTLNTISSLLRTDIETADRMIAQLGDILRLSMDIDGKQEVPLHQEIEFLKKYLDIEQIRFRDRLHIMYNIDAEALNAFVPNLILQPLVENAIRHGIAPLPKGGAIDIRVQRDNGTLKIKIQDNGKGIQKGRGKKGGNGVGLANTTARLKQLYGSDYKLIFREIKEGGLSVELSIPYRKTHDSATLERNSRDIQD